MREAEQQVPQRRHQQTPLYLGATAGMRLLRSDVRAYTHTHHNNGGNTF